MARRTAEISELAFRPWLYVAGAGALVLLAALVALAVQLWVSIHEREATRVTAGDPWDGRGLEWSIAAPPPEYNYALPPHVDSHQPFYDAKRRGDPYPAPQSYEDIEMPRNSAVGPVLGILGAMIAFGLVWHMWWLAIFGFIAVVVTLVARGFARDTDRIISAAEVERIDRAWRHALAAAHPIAREVETSAVNQGLAEVAS